MSKLQGQVARTRQLSAIEIESVADAGEIPQEQRKRFAFWLDRTLGRFDLAKEGFAQIPTRQQRIKHLQRAKKIAKALRGELREGWVEGHMIVFECDSPSSGGNAGRRHAGDGLAAAEKRVRRDLKAIDHLLERLSKMIEEAKLSADSNDEIAAAKNAAKPHLDHLARSITSYWSNILKRGISLHEDSDLIAFAAAIRQIAEGRPEISSSTIRSWLLKNTAAHWKRTYIRELEALGMTHAEAVEMADAIKKPNIALDPILAASRDFKASR